MCEALNPVQPALAGGGVAWAAWGGSQRCALAEGIRRWGQCSRLLGPAARAPRGYTRSCAQRCVVRVMMRERAMMSMTPDLM